MMSVIMCNLPIPLYAQSQSIQDSSTKTTSSNQNNLVKVSSSFAVEVTNQTLKTKEGMLRNAVIGFLTSGPNVLKLSPTDQTVVKTKIVNQIANATQNVEGIEATNVVIGVEVSKALRTIVSSFKGPNQSSTVAIETYSTCKPSAKLISCENTVTLK